MLIIGETYNQHKAFLWSCLHTCQDLIKAVQATGTKDPLAREVVQLERQAIKDLYDELKALRRWFLQSGMEENEAYQPPSRKAWWASLTDEQQAEEAEKAYRRDMEIAAIKERNGWE